MTMKGILPREANILREQRLFLEMTQQEVANELGISLQQYQRYEYGDRDLRKMPMELGLKICYLLEIDPYELIFGNESPV
jgi:transcriptional regulator with XRE-family HTH domain